MPFVVPHARKIEAPSEIIRSGLVSRWPLDDGAGSGTARDDQGTNPGTLTNMNPATAWVTGRLGGDVALRFAGSPESVDVAHAAELQPSPITVTLWFKLNANPATWAGLIGKTDSSWSNGFGIFFQNDLIHWYYGNGANIYLQSARKAFDYSDRAWHLVIATYDGTTRRIYIDDVEGNSNDVPAPLPDVTEPLNLGYMNLGDYILGDEQDVRIYNRELTPAERTQIFNNAG